MSKKIFTLIILLILLSTSAVAGINIKKALCAYTHNLDCKTTGVIESSLVFITKLRLNYPAANFDKSLEKIEKLLGEDHPPALNYKLFLTKLILSADDINIALPVLPEHSGPTDFFIKISEVVFRNMEITRK